MIKYYFETERLYFRAWKETDKPIFAQMNANPNVMKYFVKALDARESDAFVHRIEKHINEKGYGLWAVELKEEKQFIGFIGFNYTDFQSDFTPCIEIGWRLHKDYWDQGYATEGAKGCLNYGFNCRGLDEVYSFTTVLNKGSEKVMQKIGMKKIKEFDHPNIEITHVLCKHVLYGIRKEEFRGALYHF
jgi:[ribosomal protein S5]-alanine N-acetyltransferase